MEWQPQQLEELAMHFQELVPEASLQVTQRGDAVHVEARIGEADWTVRWDEPVCTWSRKGREYRFILILFQTKFSMTGHHLTLEVRKRENLGCFVGWEKMTGVQEVFLRRSMKAVQRLGELSEPVLKEAISASSDPGVLVSALQSEEALEPVGAHDPLQQAKLRGIAAKQALLESHGGTLTAEEAAKLLNMTRQGVDLKRKKGQLLALELGKRGYAYPAWQFGTAGVLPGLERTLQALEGNDAWMQLAFFVNANPRVSGRAPLEGLAEGKVEEVVRAAGAFGEQGAS